MLDKVQLDFAGDQQVLDLLLALVALGRSLDHWLPTPDISTTPPPMLHAIADPDDPVVDCVLGLLAVRETLRRGLDDLGIDPSRAPSPTPPPSAALTTDLADLLR